MSRGHERQQRRRGPREGWLQVIARPVAMRLVLAYATIWLLPALAGAQPAPTRVSISTWRLQGNSTSLETAISADGRWVAFASLASTLVEGDTNGTADIFVHDRWIRTTTRVNVGPGGAEADAHPLGSRLPAISGDGRWVAFESWSSNLVADDTNNWEDVFVHDRQTGTTTRVSVGPGGIQGNHVSGSPSISADGRFVVFDSAADNLVAGDTNNVNDVFVHDRQTATTTRVSVGPAGLQGNNGSRFSAISADGRWVAFQSFAGNLVAGDTNGEHDIFVHDRQTATTTRVSVGAAGEANFTSHSAAIRQDS